jgi:small subunit ribosomal protein S4
LCRREGAKLYLKGDRCHKATCAVDKRGPTPPGQHGRDVRRQKVSGYGEQLREKQKVKRIYGMLEKQFRIFFEKAAQQRGVTGENLLSMLERRLDNTAFRLGFAVSRQQARQLINHGHVTVNKRKVNIPSFQVRPGDVVAIREASRKNPHVLRSWETAPGRGRPSWLEVTDLERMEGRVTAYPRREDVQEDIKEQLIVELYSK